MQAVTKSCTQAYTDNQTNGCTNSPDKTTVVRFSIGHLNLLSQPINTSFSLHAPPLGKEVDQLTLRINSGQPIGCFQDVLRSRGENVSTLPRKRLKWIQICMHNLSSYTSKKELCTESEAGSICQYFFLFFIKVEIYLSFLSLYSGDTRLQTDKQQWVDKIK